MARENKFRKPPKTVIKDRNMFAFVCHVMNLKSLHYGYWDPEDKNNISLDGVKEAQAKYSSTLLSIIPKKVKTILDVGCGTGEISHKLANKGYNVTAISPETIHEDFSDCFSGNKNLTFINTKFEELKLNQQYDLILMSESQNYFDTDKGFKQCKKYLKPGGYLLISGMFKKGKTSRFERVINEEKSYINKARDYGLMLVKSEDITANVMPTLEFMDQGLNKFFIPVLELLYREFEKRSRFKLMILRFFFSKEVKKFIKMKSYYAERFSPELFKKHIKYLRLLFSLNDRPA